MDQNSHVVRTCKSDYLQQLGARFFLLWWHVVWRLFSCPRTVWGKNYWNIHEHFGNTKGRMKLQYRSQETEVWNWSTWKRKTFKFDHFRLQFEVIWTLRCHKNIYSKGPGPVFRQMPRFPLLENSRREGVVNHPHPFCQAPYPPRWPSHAVHLDGGLDPVTSPSSNPFYIGVVFNDKFGATNWPRKINH